MHLDIGVEKLQVDQQVRRPDVGANGLDELCQVVLLLGGWECERPHSIAKSDAATVSVDGVPDQLMWAFSDSPPRSPVQRPSPGGGPPRRGILGAARCLWW